jgi:hypothetical protein
MTKQHHHAMPYILFLTGEDNVNGVETWCLDKLDKADWTAIICSDRSTATFKFSNQPIYMYVKTTWLR